MNEKLVDLLMEEYKIVQTKIDKIGEFQLRVRGWSITLETAFLAVLVRYFSLLTVCLFIPLILAIIIIFQFMEQEQREIVSALAKRAFDLEKAIDRLTIMRYETERKRYILTSSIINNLKGFPRVAITLRNYSRNRTKNAIKNMFVFKTHIFHYCQYLLLLVSFAISIFWLLYEKNIEVFICSF
jgi:hypothetical protein